ncbi:MAG: YIP1 family protein [Trueperaceae bacterium]
MLDLAAAAELIRDVLRMTSGFAETVVTTPGAGRLAVIVVVLAGLSESVGESVVLFANRVKPKHFVRSLFISAFIFAFTYFFLAASIWAVARLFFVPDASFRQISTVVALAQAPRLFGFLVFLPYFGLATSVLLWIWGLLATTVGVVELLALTAWQAAAVVALGSLLLLTLQRTIGRPLLALARIARRRAAGVDLITDRRKLRELIDSGPDEGLRPHVPERRRRLRL